MIDGTLSQTAEFVERMTGLTVKATTHPKKTEEEKMIVPSSTQTPKAGGLTLVAEVDQDVFWSILKKTDQPVVLTVRSGLPKMCKYLTHYGGYYFVTKSKAPLDFSQVAEVIAANKIMLNPQLPNL